MSHFEGLCPLAPPRCASAGKADVDANGGEPLIPVAGAFTKCPRRADVAGGVLNVVVVVSSSRRERPKAAARRRRRDHEGSVTSEQHLLRLWCH